MCAVQVGAVPTPVSNHRRSWPIAPACQYRLHPPRAASAGEAHLADAQAPALLHPGPAHQQDALPQLAPAPWYRQRCDACGPSSSYRHHSREAPFFRRLDALAINDSCAGTRLSSISYSHPVAQGFMDPLPGSVLSPGAEVVKRRAPKGQVVRQHPPRAPAPKHVHDGVHHLPARVLDRTASGFRSGQQRFQQLPLCVTEIAGIGLSVHGDGLHIPHSCV